MKVTTNSTTLKKNQTIKRFYIITEMENRPENCMIIISTYKCNFQMSLGKIMVIALREASECSLLFSVS